PVFVKRELSTETAYVGEAVTMTIKIYFRQKIANIEEQSDTIPNVRLYESKDQRSYTEVVKGATYQVHEVVRVIFPQAAGKIDIPATVFDARIVVPSARRQRGRSMLDDFFGNSFFNGGQNLVRKVLRSEAQSLEVKVLPKAKRPKE